MREICCMTSNRKSIYRTLYKPLEVQWNASRTRTRRQQTCGFSTWGCLLSHLSWKGFFMWPGKQTWPVGRNHQGADMGGDWPTQDLMFISYLDSWGIFHVEIVQEDLFWGNHFMKFLHNFLRKASCPPCIVILAQLPE